MKVNWMQRRQDEGAFELTVRGVTDWMECLQVPIKLKPSWAKLCGAAEVPLIDYIRKEAELNVQSFERSVMIAFLNMGFQLEELEVEIEHPERAKWGRCVWYKDHPNYQKPIDKMFEGTKINNPAFYYATFRTEHAGDQHAPFYSMQMMASTSIIPHKTLIFRKVDFSPPKQKDAKSVAA